MSVKMHYVKIVGGGIVVVGLLVAVIVLAVEVARLSNELNNKPETDNPWNTNYRLPTQLDPNNYDIFMHPNMADDTFSGQMSLTVNVVDSSLNYMPLHQKNLTITNPTIVNLDAKGRFLRNIEVASSLEVPENEFFVILPKEPLAPGSYKVSVDFSGSLKQPEIVGIYSSTYSDSGETKKIVTSKFEPTYARRAFPCLDEPDKKAHFTISMVRPKGDNWIALSNMDEKEVIAGPGENEETVVFNPSVKMSTYLACFIVSQFENQGGSVTNGNGEQFPVRVYGRPELADLKLPFPLSVALAVTKYYIDYFKIDYPLPKLDLIGIPDFVSGAMENWGLITFRETNLLVDEENDAISNLQQVGTVVSHEIAHMWFGNLVTMKWWDDLWLNEGFASYMEYKALDNHKKDWKMLDQFLVSDLQPVMALDAQLSSHPIIQPVAHPDQITEIFDTITYSKGCSVIRMLEGILGETIFQNGVSKYLKRFQYENAVTNDLWQSLTEAAEDAGLSIDVARVMNTWTLQMGLPVVDVAFNTTSKVANVKQTRFFGSPAAKQNALMGKESPYDYRWDVPLSFFSSESASLVRNEWLRMEDSSVNIDFTPATQWIKFNRNQIGFYRVNYDTDMWEQLIEALKVVAVGATDRSSLIDDVFSLADGKLVEYSLALKLSLYLTNENEYVPWATASSKFLKLLPFMRNRLAFNDFKKLVADLVSTQYGELTWTAGTDEAHLTKRLRSTILNLACSSGYQECLTAAAEPFTAWIADPTQKGDVNVRQLMYNFGMESEGNKDGNWDKVWARYLTETDPQEKLKLMIALTYVRDGPTLSKYLQLARDENNVRGQDYFTVLQSMSDNPIGSSLVWDYVRNNWQELVDRFTLNSRSLGRLIPRISQNFDTQVRLDEMKAFFAANPNAGAGAAARAQALEKVEANIQWVSLYYQGIENWLKDYVNPE